MSLKNNHIKRALIIRAGRLGDTVWGTTAFEPVIALLGEQTRIDIIIKKGMRALFEHDPRIGSIFEIEHRGIPLLFCKTKLSVLLKSMQQPYDLAVNLETSTHFNSLMWLLRTARKITAAPLPPEYILGKQHYVDYLRYTLAQGIPAALCQDAEPSLRPPENIDIPSLVGTTQNYLCLHPGNSLLAMGKPALRSWPESHWRELVTLIARQYPELRIVLIGEKSERALSEAVAAQHPEVINLAGCTTLQQLMAVLAKSRTLITTDTGPAHVAAALSTPVISIFGPSNPRNTRPFASIKGWTVALTKDVGCNPCVETKPFDLCRNNKCMQLTTPYDVMNILDDALHKRPVSPIIFE
jgi:heptosyltransferase-2